MIVVVVLVLAGLAVLAAVVALAMGHGGELTLPRPDHPPLPAVDDPLYPGGDSGPYRLPRVLWGYQVDVTDQAVGRLRHALWERDARIAALEHELADLHRRREEPGEPPPKPPWDSVDVVKDDQEARP